jgi:hypothetical protein
MPEGLLELGLMVLLCSLPQVVGLAGTAVLIAAPLIVATRWRRKGGLRPPAVERAQMGRANTEAGEAVEEYGFLAPTSDLVGQWERAMVVKSLGDELEARFKALLDRALAEDFFNRFGDSFMALMKVPCYHIVEPATGMVQQMWNAVIKRHVDFLICDRWALRPVTAFMVWLGEGAPPLIGGSAQEIGPWGVRGGLTTREWEQWIAAGVLISGGIPTLLSSRDQIEMYLARPEVLLETIEPYLVEHLERDAVREAATA